jgi:hypothetical protein
LKVYQIRTEMLHLKLVVLSEKQTPIKLKVGQRRDLYPTEWQLHTANLDSVSMIAKLLVHPAAP